MFTFDGSVVFVCFQKLLRPDSKKSTGFQSPKLRHRKIQYLEYGIGITVPSLKLTVRT